MPTEITDIAPEYRRIALRHSAVINTLEREYAIRFPDSQEESFMTNVVKPAEDVADWLARSTSPFGLEVLEVLSKRVTDGRQEVEVSEILVHTSCAYAFAALAALRNGDKDLAWDLLCHASFFSGSPAFTNHFEVVFPRQLAKAELSARASKAGAKRHDKTNKMKEHAYAFIRSRAHWETQALAVRTTAANLRKEFGEHCISDFEGTIKRWMKEMPDRLQLIPSLANQRKQDD